MNIPKISCAFHKEFLITHFCQSSSCLLPLCQQCITIHHKQHEKIPEKMKIIEIRKSIKQIQKLACNQNDRIQKIYRDTLNSIEKSLITHHELKKTLFEESSQIINLINEIYAGMIKQVDNSLKMKENWFRQFTSHINLARTELIHIQNSLNGENYLRYVIMWNKLQPQKVITEVISNEKLDWLQPVYQKVDIHNLLNKISQPQHLKIYQLNKDPGLSKIIKAFQVLRYGQQQIKIPKQSGIFVTKKQRTRKLSNAKNFDKL